MSKIGPGNLPQGHHTGHSPKLIPTAKEEADYMYDCENVKNRGYATDQEAYRIKVYELQYTNKRD